jgi:ElaB/YqjD/DUF883 family membrane-anchored ribosome-binding protein
MATMMERIEQRLSNVADTAREVKEEASDLVEQAHDNVETSLKKNPFKMLGVAVLIGFALGALYKL